MEIDISRILSGGRHIYAVTVSYSDRGCVTMHVELTEKETSEGPELIRSAALGAAVSVLEKALVNLRREIDQ